MSNFKITVKTSDRIGAGTNASVFIALIDKTGKKSETRQLDAFFRNDFERDQCDDYYISTDLLDEVVDVEIWRTGLGLANSWHLEYIKVENTDTKATGIFPFHRWLETNKHYFIQMYDCTLPQNCKYREQRAREMKNRAEIYKYTEAFPKIPYQVHQLHDDDKFAVEYRLDMTKTKIFLLAEKFWVLNVKESSDTHFKNFDEMIGIFDKFSQLDKPRGINDFRKDTFFGQKRLNSCNPKLIKLCTEIPEKFAIDKETVKPLLEGKTVDDAIAAKKLFIIDLTILEGIHTNDDTVLCTPYCLLYVNDAKELVPVAIQLFKEPGSENPVFYPSDDPNVWLQAKIWYCHADCSYHQSVTHLGFTHLMMESISVAMNKSMSLSHPIHKLIAPHLLYLLAINDLALKKLVAPGGWIDKTMSVGRIGVLEMVGKRLYNMDLSEAEFTADLKKRGVDDEAVLPGYYYRDDAKLINDAIQNYVSRIVKLFYKTEQDIIDDTELQAWGKEIVTPKPEGLGYSGLPGDGKFTKHDQVTWLVSYVIYTCSVEHAAVNFSQYDNYAFPGAYPMKLQGKPLTNKNPITEEEVIGIFYDKDHMLNSMVVTHILSERGTKALGDFEVTYLYEPEALKIVQEFKNELKKIQETISKRDSERTVPYLILNPAEVPNSISI